ncbi:uncharacterized protein Gasu_30600 [Galdieria sulphuraria]|uniref:C3H1-type domain-containing protein n=1 Tax=Galdieria sulphuraria TaxID=130081 RepID=M2Y120_GALSU|nr:uncharacterized protein Gasu_30600 [Galdieria sulphuraria]EME29623.1 hypothetical protein Gasu_30600 [Galdieria sulphuraria]|eukprot:XP_005706143.1 hypothetical protein Gasu_30600 [Galdieria sulphuraria]
MDTSEQGSEQGEESISNNSQQLCKDYFGKYGICPKGDSCPFAHGEDAIVVRSEEDIRRWQREEIRGSNSKWSGYDLETLAKILRERLRHLLNKPLGSEDGSAKVLETKEKETDVNKELEMTHLKENVGSRDSKRPASEVELPQDNNHFKVFKGSRPTVKVVQNSRIRWKTRQSTVDVFYKELMKKGLSEQEASERALREEEDIFHSCENGGEIVYTNTASHRFRKLLKASVGDTS